MKPTLKSFLSPEPKEELHRAAVTFRTADNWTAIDLSRFVSAVEAIYNSLLIAGIGPTLEKKVRAHVEDYIADNPLPLGTERAFAAIIWAKTKLVDMAPKHLLSLIKSKDFEPHRVGYELRIRRIRMASPGWFSFEGLERVIEQFRNLIKDIVHFKAVSAHDQAAAELEILGKYLDLRDSHLDLEIPMPKFLRDRGYTLKQARSSHLITSAKDGIEVLRQLEAKGKLLLLAEYLTEDEPPPGGAKEG